MFETRGSAEADHDIENAALPHGSGTDRLLNKGKMVLIDAGGEWGGYVSDITRVSAPIRT